MLTGSLHFNGQGTFQQSNLFFFFYFFGTLFGVQMILKHSRGFGLFTSAHIKFYDAVCSNLFDDEGGKAKAGLNLSEFMAKT